MLLSGVNFLEAYQQCRYPKSHKPATQADRYALDEQL